MARDRANIRIDIWADQEWRDLSVGAQHLYLLLLSHPTLSYAGVADWKPGRLAAMSDGTTREQIIEAAAELQKNLFIVVDEESEEVLIRSFIKHDGLIKQPKLVVSMMNAYAAIASRLIREVLAFEVQKLRKAEPTLKIWEAKQAQTLLRAKGTDIRLCPELTPNGGQGFTPAFTPNADQSQGLPTSTTTSTATLNTSSAISSQTKEIFDLCGQLADAVEVNLKAKSKNPEKVIRPEISKAWVTQMNLLIHKDGHEIDEVREIIEWAVNDEFWSSNVMSPAKLRKQFDQLILKKPKGPVKPKALPHIRIEDFNGPYCQSCNQTWPCLTESRKSENPF